MSISTIYNYITIVHKSLLQHSYTEHILKLACSNIIYKNVYQSHILASFKITASKKHHPSLYHLHLKYGPITENNSYKGYSPPKCTCNAISHIQVKTYTILLKCLHAMDENVTHPVACPESSLTPSHMHMPSVKTIIYVQSMTIVP